MIDLETMGQGSDAAIVSIGAVKFDENGIGDTFYSVINLQSSVEAGLKIDASTVMWWLKQNGEARSALLEESVDLESVLQFFTDFVGVGGYAVWGNGSDFDNVILANAYKSIGAEAPWQFWMGRCYRTMKNMFRDVKLKRKGTHHNALDDAISQAEHLIEIINEKGIKI